MSGRRSGARFPDDLGARIGRVSRKFERRFFSRYFPPAIVIQVGQNSNGSAESIIILDGCIHRGLCITHFAGIVKKVTWKLISNDVETYLK